MYENVFVRREEQEEGKGVRWGKVRNMKVEERRDKKNRQSVKTLQDS